jgi:hypothetical protein
MRTSGIRPRLYEIIERSATAALSLQSCDGSLPPGHNGPYHDPETPVRNTGHWLITFLKAHDLSGDPRFHDAASRAARYLSSNAARPHDATFVHRTSLYKDNCNGLIGQAWTIEALVAGADRLDMPHLTALAKKVFLLHEFDGEFGLWQITEIDGSSLGYDPTFNHQLWFAAAGSLIPGAQIEEQVLLFLDLVPANMGQVSWAHPQAQEGRTNHFQAWALAPPR